MNIEPARSAAGAAALAAASAYDAEAPETAHAVLPLADVQLALFLDVDGCLVEFQPTPEDVKIDAPVLRLLERLHAALGGALAIISGRTLADLDRLFAPLELPCAGQYGLERRSADGTVHGAPLPDPAAIESMRRESFALLRRMPGLLVEDKGASIALHYREAPQIAAEVAAAAAEIAAPLAGAYEVQAGSMVRELKPLTCDKGIALKLYCSEAPFRNRVPVFLGDDIADEPAFAAVNAVGGISVSVATTRPTLARYSLDSPAQVHEWLTALLDTLRARQTPGERTR